MKNALVLFIRISRFEARVSANNPNVHGGELFRVEYQIRVALTGRVSSAGYGVS